MMEAAGYGLPLITIFEAPEAAKIVGTNHVGLVGTALVARSDVEYTGLLSRLISDETFRKECGGRPGMQSRECMFRQDGCKVLRRSTLARRNCLQ